MPRPHCLCCISHAVVRRGEGKVILAGLRSIDEFVLILGWYVFYPVLDLTDRSGDFLS